jgi:hypothetical protein
VASLKRGLESGQPGSGQELAGLERFGGGDEAFLPEILVRMVNGPSQSQGSE